MGYLKDFVIPFEGLSIGNHDFTFKVNRLFFEEIEYLEIENGNINIQLDFEKQESMLILQFHVKGDVEVACDRCTKKFNYPIEGDQKLLIQFGESNHEESGELIVITRGENEINLAPYIYEYINLMLPIQRMHPDDSNGESTCDPEMLEKLNELEVHEKQVDPRWDALKKLKKN